MPALSLVGPSNQLRAGKPDQERTVNWMPALIESGQGKGGAVAYLKQAPGLSSPLATLAGSIRGLFVARDVLYAVAGGTLYQVSSSWVGTSKGTIGGSELVNGAANNTQLCIVNGATGYVYDLDAGTISTIGTGWRGSDWVGVIDGFGLFSEPNTTQFYLSSNQDFTALDPLDFASAEGSTGPILGGIITRREAVLLKTNNTEVWFPGGGEFYLSRNESANIEVGCSAKRTIQKAAGTVFWLGRDERGAAVVFAMAGYVPQRISSHALEEKLAALTDLSDGYAMTWHIEGQTLYVLNVTGLNTTWAYDVAAGIWFELADFVDGEFVPWRVTAHAYVYGKHVVGDADGNLYELSHAFNTYAGDPLVRDRISPHQASPSMTRQRIGSMQIDCQVGDGLDDGLPANLMMRYSDDGGRTWGNWRYLSLGAVGNYKNRVRATMLGSTRDRVWEFRVTDDVRCDLLAAVVNEV